MLKNIRLHLAKQDSDQEEIEKKMATEMEFLQRDNINTLQRFIPSLMPYVQELKSTNISVFCNKYGQTNIVDYSLGRVFYGEKPEEEVQMQITHFENHAQFIQFDNSKKSELADDTLQQFRDNIAHYNSLEKLPSNFDCLVILGCGLGQHINYMVNHYDIKHIIIYEPEAQYLNSSMLTNSWRNLLNVAKSKNTNIYFQVLKDGRDLMSDIDDLRTHFNIDGFFLYKHYNHEIFDKIAIQLTQKPWSQLEEMGFSFQAKNNIANYIPQWTYPLSPQQYSPITDSELYRENLSIFKGFFPDVYQQMQEFAPTSWFPVELPGGEISIVHREHLVSWYSHQPKDDCRKNYELFSEQPHKDGLILSYNGKKLSHYLHYQFVAKSENLLNEVKEEEGALPYKIQSIILFGLGVGYQLEELFQNHEIEHIFICEPNIDFFHASLFAIDWRSLLKKIAESETRIYLNIGDDGSNLMRDLLNQFYSIGPYILNNTYFYQCYYNGNLNAALAQLREQLKIVISMGEYFDHAYYGITQTVTTIESGYSLLKREAKNILSFDDKATPVFIVGNGPSLDGSIELLKEEADNAIIVSCGTSLKVLYKHGIVPDFHAEIEQNRTTFDWATLVGDKQYLKQINLLSCNGIHPDTCKLYKDVLIIFKEGESSTVSTLEVLGEEHYEILDYAFPTVANFAVNLFTRLNFESLYLIGVDLGFIDNKYHHSKDSGYYLEDGKELYDYAQQNNTSIQTPGNFRKLVSTKLEFKIAKQIMESSIQKSGRQNHVYNCSDGALINGTQPLYIDNILLMSTPQQKRKSVDKLTYKAFQKIDVHKFRSSYQAKYATDKLERELAHFEQHLNEEITTKEQASKFIDKQKEILFDSYKDGGSLLFYFLFGTVNFANAALVKLLYASTSEEDSVSYFNKEKELWRNCLSLLKDKILGEHKVFDVSEFNRHVRVAALHKDIMAGKSILIATNSKAFAQSIHFFVAHRFHWQAKIQVTEIDKLDGLSATGFDYIIYHQQPELLPSKFFACLEQNIHTAPKGTDGTLIVVNSSPGIECKQLLTQYPALAYLVYAQDDEKVEDKYWIQDQFNLAFEAMSAVVESSKFDIIVPKSVTVEDSDQDTLKRLLSLDIKDYDIVIEFKRLITLNFTSAQPINQMEVMFNGDRGAVVKNLIFPDSYVRESYSRDKYLENYKLICQNIPALAHPTQLDSPDVELLNK